MRLELELQGTESSSPRLAGVIGRADGPRHSFIGVMELIAVIERLLDEGPAPEGA